MMFLTASLVAMGLSRLPVAHVHFFTPKDPWVEEWETLIQRPVH